MAQKWPDTRGNILNIEFQVTFAPPCVVGYAGDWMLLTPELPYFE
jgi:hypothetical protein